VVKNRVQRFKLAQKLRSRVVKVACLYGGYLRFKFEQKTSIYRVRFTRSPLFSGAIGVYGRTCNSAC
jgi:hypothetical protein